MPETLTSWKTTPTQTLDVNGTSFTYRELGPRGGTPLVFLHHFTAVLDDWDPRVIDGVAAKRHVITFDNRGVGSTAGKVPHTIAAMAADATAFIRALGHDLVDLIGFSLGGGVAQEITLTHPELVRRLILTGTGVRGGGGLTKMPVIVGGAYTKAALTRVTHAISCSSTATRRASARPPSTSLVCRNARPTASSRSPTRRVSHSCWRSARPASASHTTSAGSSSPRS